MNVSVTGRAMAEGVSLLTPWMFGFDPGSVLVRFVVENVVLVLVQAFIQVLRFSPAMIISHMLHTDVRPHVALTSLGTLKRQCCFESREHWI
jgi:hypothetical protein